MKNGKNTIFAKVMAGILAGLFVVSSISIVLIYILG